MCVLGFKWKPAMDSNTYVNLSLKASRPCCCRPCELTTLSAMSFMTAAWVLLDDFLDDLLLDLGNNIL